MAPLNPDDTRQAHALFFLAGVLEHHWTPLRAREWWDAHRPAAAAKAGILMGS
jgi:hypothetical protein